LQAFFNEEQYPIPDGFSLKTDVNKEAPRLYTDDFYLFYIQNVGKIGLEFYTQSLSNCGRLDVCEYFTECLNESARLLNKATEVMLKKGTFIRAPYIPTAKKVEYIRKQSYLEGWFGHRRPLNAIEISNIYFNMIQNQLGRTFLMGLSQVANSASAWDTLPTGSTISPFSDKLIMFHTTTLSAAGIAHYGRSFGMSPRHDLGAIYVRLTAEVSQFAEDGANIMIEYGWLEQPPQAIDRDQIAKG
jgi:hypothetical protein